MNKYTVILNFSSRANGNCAKVCREIQTATGGEILSAAGLSACGGCDYECLKDGQECPNLTGDEGNLYQRICNSRMAYYVLPNYCGGPCANYWSFNERSVGYFCGDRIRMKQYMNVPKRFIVISNTEGFEDAMQQQTSSQPEILYLKSSTYGKRSIDGNILDSQSAKDDLMAFLAKEPR